MISLIFVNAPKNEFYGEILLNSIFKRTFLIDEIICVNTDKSTKEKYVENGIEIIKLGIAERICHNIHKQKFKGCEIAAGHQHAFGLQCGIEESKNDIIILSDSDVFFYTNIESIYLKYLNDGFQFVGFAHHNQKRVDGNFPTVINLMVNKQNLPDKNYFLENRSIIETWLSTPLDGGQSKKEFELCVNINQKYPYKNKIFDTGALLYMWCQEKNMNWLSFLTRDCKNYNSKNIMANKPYERIGSKNLAFHLCGGSFDQFDRKSIWEENKKTMLEEYKKSEEEYNASKNVFVY